MSSETEDKLLLTVESDDTPIHPPPPYRPVEAEVTEIQATPEPLPPVAVKYSKPMPLPTYAQSEKYEAEGVLDFNQKDMEGGGNETEDESQQHVRGMTAGTWCDFVLFFLICSILSVVGFVFSMCLATTVAAQSGAVAGLGIALVSKPIMFEMYDNDAMHSRIALNFCSDSGDESCVYRVYTLMRFCVWMIGLIGLFLFYRGLATFLHVRRSVRIYHQ